MSWLHRDCVWLCRMQQQSGKENVEPLIQIWISRTPTAAGKPTLGRSKESRYWSLRWQKSMEDCWNMSLNWLPLKTALQGTKALIACRLAKLSFLDLLFDYNQRLYADYTMTPSNLQLTLFTSTHASLCLRTWQPESFLQSDHSIETLWDLPPPPPPPLPPHPKYTQTYVRFSHHLSWALLQMLEMLSSFSIYYLNLLAWHLKMSVQEACGVGLSRHWDAQQRRARARRSSGTRRCAAIWSARPEKALSSKGGG